MLGYRILTAEDYLAILKRRWRIIAIPTVILPIAAYAITFLIPPQYVSQTLVLIEQQKVPDTYVKPVVSSDLDSRLASMREQILSRSRLQPIIERDNLYPTKSMDDRIELARTSIEIKPIHSQIAHSGGLPGFFISFRASTPRTAQVVCGEITSLFVSANLSARQQSAEGTTDFLKTQLDDAKRTLDDQDSKLAAFQSKYSGKLPGEETPNLNMLTSLNTQLEATTQQLARMEQDKSYEESMLAQQAHESPAGGVQQQMAPQTEQLEMQKLLAQEAEFATTYTTDHPDMVSLRHRISELRQQMAKPKTSSPVASSAPSPSDSIGVQQLRAQVGALTQGIKAKKQEQAQTQRSIRMYQDRIQSTPLVEAQYKQLTRDYQTAQQFYDSLLTKMNDSKMATDLERRQQGEQFRVMDEPNLPDSPTFPNRLYFAGAGFVAGFVFGLLIVALVEYRDTALRTEQDVWAFTKLPTLAVICFADELAMMDPKSEDRPDRPQKKRRTAKKALMDVRG